MKRPNPASTYVQDTSTADRDSWLLQQIRYHYAQELRWSRWIRNERVIAAFAEVPREDFLGPGPWKVFNPPTEYVDTDDANPRHIYHNVRISLDPSRLLNNGEPGLTATVMELVDPQQNDIVIHIGCGTGYYTAIWSVIIGPGGMVHGYEIDRELADAARHNLLPYENVEVHFEDGLNARLAPTDVIIISAGTNRLKGHWLDALNVNGSPFFSHSSLGKSIQLW